MFRPGCTSAGVDVLRSRRLTDQVILVEPGAFLCHHHGLGGFLRPRVDHLRDRIGVCRNKIGRRSNRIFIFGLFCMSKIRIFLTITKTQVTNVKL